MLRRVVHSTLCPCPAIKNIYTDMGWVGRSMSMLMFENYFSKKTKTLKGFLIFINLLFFYYKVEN